jgi:hypothetical protein
MLMVCEILEMLCLSAKLYSIRGGCDVVILYVTWDAQVKKYFTILFSENWLNAQNTCRAKSARLVSVQSKEENEFVKKLSNNSIWLGLETRGVFRGEQHFLSRRVA